jgi:MbtH protein
VQSNAGAANQLTGDTVPPTSGGTMNEQLYRVVVNHEDQYSIWPLERDLPLGWSATDMSGGRDDCLAFIDQVWTDMRPLSLRRQMDSSE